MWTYSLICTNRNVAPSRNVVRMPACSPKRLPLLADSSAQCTVIDEESRIAVLMPAISFGSSVPSRGPRGALHDPDEEVGREEGPEDHHLGDDEKQHPEELGLDPRGAVGLRRPVVLVVLVAVGASGDRAGFHQAAASVASARRGSTGLPVALAHALDAACRAHPLELVARQRRDHDLGDVEVLRRRSWPPCRGRGRRSWPAATMCSLRRSSSSVLQPLARRAHRASPSPRVLRHDDDEAVRAVGRPAPRACARSSAPADRLVGERRA